MSNIDQLCSVLKSLELSKREIKIYKILLDRGLAIPSVISVISGIPRSMCYKYLNKLSRIGLITETTLNNQKAYFAESPKKVLDLIDKKNKNLMLQRKIASDAISKMDVNRLKKISSPKIQYFNGIEGIKKLYMETVKNNQSDIKIFFGWDFYPQELRNFIANEYIPLRVSKQIPCKVLTNNSIIEERDHLELRTRKKIKNNFHPNVEINIYDDKVNFVTISNDQYRGLMIQNEEISSSLKEIFRALWNA